MKDPKEPQGYHTPTDEELDNMAEFFGMNQIVHDLEEASFVEEE